MWVYFTGMFVRDTTNHYEMMDIKISHMTVYNWVSKYSKMVEKYLKEITPWTVDRGEFIEIVELENSFGTKSYLPLLATKSINVI